MKRIVIIAFVFLGISARAHVVPYPPSYLEPTEPVSVMKSQMIMAPTGATYTSTVYSPFDQTTPAQYSEATATGNPTPSSQGGPNRRRGKILGPDTDPAQEFPIGEPWVLAFFALLLGGAVFLKTRKTKTTIEINHNTTNMNNNTPMKNNIVNKTSLTLLLLLTLGVGQMWATLTEMTDTQVKAVLDNSKVMVYLGCGSGWSGSTSGHMYLNNGSSTTHIIDVTTSRGSSDNDPWFFWKEVTTALSVGSSGTYYLSNSGSWPGQSITASLQAGAAYFMNRDWKDRSGKYSDNIFYITSPSASIPTTAQSVTEGSSLSVTTTLTKGYKDLPYSAVHTTMNLKFFAKDGSGKFWEVGNNTSLSSATTPSTTLSGVAELSAGTYTIYAALYDSYGVYIKASNTFTLTVNSASTATLTYHANWYTTGTSGSVPAAQTVAVDATATVAGKNTLAMTNYTFSGWNTEEYITGTDYAVGSSITMDEDKDLYAKWTRSITLDQNGATTNGTTSVTGTYNCSTLPSITNPEKLGYTFVGWRTENDGTGNLVINTSGALQSGVYHWTDEVTPSNRFQRYPTSTSPLYATWTQDITLNANTSNHGSGDNTSATVILNKNALSSITHCTPATGYSLEGYYTDATGGTKVLNANGGFASSSVTDYITSSKWIKAGATTLYAHYTANTYDVILNKNGATSGSNQTVTATFDADMPTVLKGGSTPISAPSKTGYTFSGYTANNNGTGTQYYTAGLTSNHIWDVATNNTNIYAKWTANNYTVTLDLDEDHKGTIAGATTSQDVTFDAATTTVPNRPTAANGYALDGYYTDHNGAGTKVINGDGTWIASVTGYTDGSKHWIHADDVTLYAYYKNAEITEITLNATTFEPVKAGDEGYVVANPTIAPTPTGTTSICWELLYDNDNPVPADHEAIDDHDGSHPDRVKFSIVGLSPGNYKIRATLHTGDGACGTGTTLSVQEASFTIASDFTVTILYKCGDVTIKSSTTSPGKPLVGTEITAPNIIGYTFSKWKAGDGVTIEDADGNGEKATATITYTANYNGSLTAIYTKKNMIYFYNTVGWSDVWVYFYTSDKYWANDWGTGAWRGQYFSGSRPYYNMHRGQMTQIEGTNIWYFDYTAEGWDGWQNVAFTNMGDKSGQGVNPDDAAPDNDHAYFSNTTSNPIQVIRRGDHKTSLPMFVPLTNQTKQKKNNNKAEYYSDGYWMNYPENTGYTLRIYSSWKDASPSREYPFPYSEDKKMPWKVGVEFNFTGQAWFMIYRNNGLSLGKSYTMKQNNHETDLDSESDQKIEIKTSAPGEYKFTLSFLNVGTVETPSYKHYIYVEYPVGIGDYRIVYKDNATWSQGTAHNASWYHPSDIIPMNSGSEEKADTVSLFVSYGSSPSAKFQKVTAINNETGVVTWEDVDGGTVDLSGITAAGVYNFIVSQPAGGESISLTKTEPYTGSYYIRTDNAGSTKWDNYRSSDHRMTYTEFSMSAANTTGEKYSHYYASWCERSTNIKFCIANDYSSCISDTLEQDVNDPYKNTTAGGYLKSDGADAPINHRYSANVRFMYNETTNKISRAYVGSSTNRARKFLMLEGNQVLKGDDNEPISDWDGKYALILADKQNWIYEHTLKIKPKTRFKLYACYAQTTVSPDGAQYFRGAYDSNNFTTDANSVILIDGSVDADYQMARIIYDFKTNRLMTAWIPSGSDVSGNMAINADVLVEREHQEPAQYITFENASSKLSGVKTVYGAMKFNRWILNNRQHSEDERTDHAGTAEEIATHHAPLPVGQQKSIYERSLYFISFPFDVNASEIFGFGHYWDEWYLEYYDGLTRAKNGYWEDSPPNWKYVTPSMLNDFVLKANEGYILGLDLDYMQADNFTFWAHGISTVELFFPSTTTQETLKQTNCTIPALSAIEGDPYRCTINRGTQEGDRRVKDSYWRCLGVPSFNIYNTSLTDGEGNAITWQPDGNTLPFIYAWNKADNTLTPQATGAFTFLPMHAYLVQNGGEIRWNNVSSKPASIVARQRNTTPTEYNWCLTLNQGETLVDQTFIRMSDDETITEEFDFNQDLIKELNSGRSDIYSYIGYERAAANSLPLNTETTTVVPLGLNIEKAGEYTFSMPAGTYGVGVTLVDATTEDRINLSALPYTVQLETGDYTSRFFLEISPVPEIATDIQGTYGSQDDSTKAHKVLIDNLLYIIRDGQIFDARGARCK